MRDLNGRVAVVTGASRGIGRGVARALGERGATVYVTGRTAGAGELSVDATARLVDGAGGRGIPVAVDHGDDAQVAALFERVAEEQGHLDILVNNVYKIPDPPAWSGGFWEHPLSIWDDQVGIGLRAHYVASWHAAPLLFKADGAGVIVNVSSPGGQRYHFNAAYGAGKAGLDRLTADMATDLADRGVAAVALYPGVVATEFARGAAEQFGAALDRAQTPLFVGRCLAALVAAPDLDERSGTIQWVDDLAAEFGVIDEQGVQPPRSVNGPATVPAELLFRLTAHTGDESRVTIPDAPHGTRVVVGVAGGTFDGPRLRGTVADAPAGDWVTVRDNGTLEVDVRLVLRTEDGAHVLMTYTGIGWRRPDHSIDVRTAPQFATGDDRYTWLNDVQGVALGRLKDGTVTYDVYRLV